MICIVAMNALDRKNGSSLKVGLAKRFLYLLTAWQSSSVLLMTELKVS